MEKAFEFEKKGRKKREKREKLWKSQLSKMPMKSQLAFPK